MINKDTINTINLLVDQNYRFFYFDKRSNKLVSSSPNNDLTVYDCHELYIGEYTTINNVKSLLKFYNEIN